MRRRGGNQPLPGHPGRARPTTPGRARRCGAIARGDDYRVPAIAVLEPVLRSARAWDQVVELLELRLAVEDAVELRLAVLGEIARIQEMERRDIDSAFATWARALTEETTEEAPRQALERLAAATGAWKRLAEVYEERMDATFDASLQHWLALRLAALYERELADLGRAADFLRKALSLPGDEAPVLASLELILRRLGENAELAEILGREAEVATRSGAAGRLPGVARRGASGRARGRGRRAGGVPRRDRPQSGACRARAPR